MIPDLTLSRRAFVARLAAVGVAMPLAMRGHVRRLGPVVRARAIGWSSTAIDARGMGLVLGAEEAIHAASLFGGSFEIVAVQRGEDFLTGVSAVIGDADCERTRQMGARAEAAGVPFLNVGCSDDELRGANCRRNMFHVAPSDAMCRDALAAGSASGRPMVWHPSLNRFGADTLNGRFVARFARPMTSDAWTAWLATKVLWESALRAGSGEAAKVADYLTRDTTQFDGHKGVPLSFRSWDHQLRQPLYVVEGAKVIEVPTASPSEPARTVLDRLGAGAVGSACHFGT